MNEPLERRRRILFTLATYAWVSLALLVALEAGLRLFTSAPAFAASLNLHMNLSTEMEPDLHGVAAPIRFTTNRWGMRGSQPLAGDEWEKATTIVTVGGSTTQCFFLDDTRTWPAVLERTLGQHGRDVWVGNAGQAGHSTRAHVKLLDEAIARIKPDCVVFLIGVNDLSLSLRPVWRWDDTMSEALLGPARSSALNLLLDHSRIAYGLYMLKEVHLDGALVQSSEFTVALPSEPVTGEEYVLSDNVDGILPSLPPFRENVVHLIRSVRSFGGKPVFLTQPLLIDRSPRWAAVRARSFWMNEERFHLSGTSYARLLDRFNEVLKDVCREHGAACLDLAAGVPHSADYYYDMVHYNDAGAELVGRKVAEFLEEYVLSESDSRPVP